LKSKLNYTLLLILLVLCGCRSEQGQELDGQDLQSESVSQGVPHNHQETAIAAVKPSGEYESEMQSSEGWVIDTTLPFQGKVIEISHSVTDKNDCHMCTTDVRLRIILPATNELISEVPMEVSTSWGSVNSDGFRLMEYDSEYAVAYTTGYGSQGNWRQFVEIFDLINLTGKPVKKYHYLVECDHGSNFTMLPKAVQDEYRAAPGGDTLNGNHWVYHKGVLKSNWKLRADGDMEFIFDGNYYSYEPIFRSGGREFMTYNAPSYSVIQPGPWGKMKEPVSVKIKGPTGQYKIGFDDLCPYLKETLTGKFLMR
jgi:hypothetical protein